MYITLNDNKNIKETLDYKEDNYNFDAIYKLSRLISQKYREIRNDDDIFKSFCNSSISRIYYLTDYDVDSYDELVEITNSYSTELVLIEKAKKDLHAEIKANVFEEYIQK